MAFLRTFWDQILLFFLTYVLPNIFFLTDICMNNTEEAKNWQKKFGSKRPLPPPTEPLCNKVYKAWSRAASAIGDLWYQRRRSILDKIYTVTYSDLQRNIKKALSNVTNVNMKAVGTIYQDISRSTKEGKMRLKEKYMSVQNKVNIFYTFLNINICIKYIGVFAFLYLSLSLYLYVLHPEALP